MRKQATPAALDLARWLLAQEAALDANAPQTQIILRGFEKLRLHLGKLVGPAGFQALFARALALAKAEVNWLANVRIGAGGSLEGFDEAAQQCDETEMIRGGTELLAQLLSLLITFIGEDLNLRLVQDIWADTAPKQANPHREETPE